MRSRGGGRGTRDEGTTKAHTAFDFPGPSPLVPRPYPGFTLIELLIVMSIIALLLSIAAPRYFHSTDRAREAVLRQDLAQMREAIDKYYGDLGRYPDRLADLVERKYLRRIPPDPLTDSAETWMAISPADSSTGSVFDIRSGAPGTALDGSDYSNW